MKTHLLSPRQEKLHALKILNHQIGLWLTIRCAIHVMLCGLLRPPFKELEKPKTEKELSSRQQISDAVTIYKFLKQRLGQTRALEVTSTVIVASGQLFIDSFLKDITHDRLVEIDEPTRQALANDRLSKFPNMTPQITTLTKDALSFRVQHCHFVHLCAAAGVPELTQAFCKVDDAYFSEVRTDIELTRPLTLARDHRPCEFHLKFKPRNDAIK